MPEKAIFANIVILRPILVMPFQRHILFFLGFIFSTLLSVANAIGAAVSDSISSHVSYLSAAPATITDSIINYGKQFLNRPYRYGSTGSDTFDCSGFTSFVYHNFGYNLEHSSAQQAQQFDTVKRNFLKTGDLVFFSGSRKSKRIGHVGIVTEAKEDGRFNFIHASCDKGVTISSSEEPYYSHRYVKANRVIGGTQTLAVASLVPESDNADLQTDNNAPVTYPSKKVKKTIPAKFHRVKSGETLSEIAEKYGLSVTELKRKNGLKGSKISLKQMLKVKDSESYTVFEPVKEVSAKKTDASTEQAAESSKAEMASSIISHKVKRGETLFSISKLYNTPVEKLKKINNLSDGKLVPGQEIKLKEVENASTVAVAKVDNQQKATTHKVASGESLFSIAKMYNVSVAELKKMNDITGSGIHVGQTLKINLPEEKNIVENIQAIKPVSAKPETKSTPKAEQPVSKPELAQKSAPELEPEQSADEEVKTEVVSKSGSTVKIIKHKVHSGESLVTLARDFKVSLDELKRINNLESTKLAVGQEVFICLNTEAVVVNPVAAPVSKPIVEEQPEEKATVIPAKSAVASRADVVSKPEPKQKTEKKSEQKPVSYKVRKGDNLNTIAKDFDISVDDLKKINDLTSNKISVGQELKLEQGITEVVSKEDAKKVELPAKAVTHKVRRGENLAGIAEKFNMTVDELKELNGLASNRINYGQQLIVSQLSSAAPKKAAATKAEPKQRTIRHKVKSGESYYSIAQKFDCSVNDLKEWNRKSSTKIKPGDVVIIKSGK